MRTNVLLDVNERGLVRWEDSIGVDPKEVTCECMNWIQLAVNRIQWQALVNTVMSHRVP
jgi:hypothetical protein